jgi:hypothetical protein
LQRALDGRGVFIIRQAVGVVEHPHGLDHCHNTEEAGILLGQPQSDQLRRLRRLTRVVLREVTDEDVGVEPDRRGLARGVRSAAPAAAAAVISSMVTCRGAA